MHITHVKKYQRNKRSSRRPLTRKLRNLSAVTSIGSFESETIENAKESNSNNTDSVTPKTESTSLSSKSNEPNKNIPPRTIPIIRVPQSQPPALPIHQSHEPQQTTIPDNIQTIPRCMKQKPVCFKMLSDQVSKHSASSPSRVYPEPPNLSLSDFDPMNSVMHSRNSIKTRNNSYSTKQTTSDRFLPKKDDRNQFCDTNIKDENYRHRDRRQLFKRCCPCCSPCCFLLTGLLLSLLLVGLATSITLASLSKTTTTTTSTTTTTTSTTSTTSGTSSTSTSITTITTTTTTEATTVTITSNACTSSWNGITVYNLCNNCPNINPYQQYSYIYTAIATQTRITFAFREDVGYFALDDVSARNTSDPTIELLTNGGFETGNLSSWIYCNPASASFSGTLETTSNNFFAEGKAYTAHGGNYYYLDGAVGNADYLSQMFTTIIGQTYNISFWLYNQGSGTNSNANLIISI